MATVETASCGAELLHEVLVRPQHERVVVVVGHVERGWRFPHTLMSHQTRRKRHTNRPKPP